MDKKFLEELLETPSVSGMESGIAKKIYNHMDKFADKVEVDEISDCICSINPESDFKVLLTGHCDEIGLMISAVDEQGFLKVINVGGIYYTTYPGHKVRVITDKGIIYGAVVNTRDLAKKEELKAKDIIIDIGAKDRKDALSHVKLGDTVIFDTDYRYLLNDKITARAMDDRVGVFIVMEALKLAREKGCKIGAYSAATTGEETSTSGAYFVASRVKPQISIAVDVTYASDYSGTDIGSTGDVKIGEGPVICNSPAIHRGVNKMLLDIAKKEKIKVQMEVATGRTGTDGDVMHQTGAGVPFALVSLPLRYMHCPNEVGSLKDIEDCIKLLAAFLVSLDGNENLKPF